MTTLFKMEHYSPAQWTLIDMANHYGLDKEVYSKRLAFGREMLEAIKEEQDMSPWINKADAPAMFTKAICAVRDILMGNETGHVIELDACNSGPAILSTLMHCITGMKNTGVIDTGVRPDGYNTILTNFDTEVEVGRKEVKTATVPYAYGSDYKPEQVFGDELFAEFEAAYEKTFPEAYFVRKVLINAWNSKALYHEFTAIDGLVAHLECKGLQKTKSTILGYTYTYAHSVNRPLIPTQDKGTKSLVANVTHCADGFVVREFDNRCNYNVRQVTGAIEMIDKHLINGSTHQSEAFLRLQDLGIKHNFVSMAVVEVMEWDCLAGAEPEYLMKLRALFERVLEYPSFETFSIHDAFKFSPKHAERARRHYNDIMAELYESPWLLNVIEDLTGDSYEWDEPTDPAITEAIRQNNYSVC